MARHQRALAITKEPVPTPVLRARYRPSPILAVLGIVVLARRVNLLMAPCQIPPFAPEMIRVLQGAIFCGWRWRMRLSVLPESVKLIAICPIMRSTATPAICAHIADGEILVVRSAAVEPGYVR